MTNFMIAYYGGTQPSSKEEGIEQMNEWKTWIQDLGEVVVNPGTPLPVSKTVTLSIVEDDNDPNAMKNYMESKQKIFDSLPDAN